MTQIRLSFRFIKIHNCAQHLHYYTLSGTIRTV